MRAQMIPVAVPLRNPLFLLVVMEVLECDLLFLVDRFINGVDYQQRQFVFRF